jgi:hypothetical protein
MMNATETNLLTEISAGELWRHAEILAQWDKTSGTPDERAAVSYLAGQLERFGFATQIDEFESLLGWPEEAEVVVRAPNERRLACITHAFTPSTPADGIEAELIHVGSGSEADFASSTVAGRIALVEGMPSPAVVLRGQQAGAAGLLFAQMDRLLHEMCVSPVWGTPTTRTAPYLPTLPVASIHREAGQELIAELRDGPVRIWLRTRTFWGWRKVPVLTGDLPGTVEANSFVLLSGHHCSWYKGAMDNGAANATMLEVARILAQHRSELRRGVRIAFWPGHTHGRYSGSTWYFDHHWEDLHDNCVLHVNVDSTGARGASIYHAMSMPETRDLAVAAVQDGAGLDGLRERQSRAGDQSFWGCGVPSVFMDLSAVPAELAANTGSSLFAAADAPVKRSGGLPWFWHTVEDTIDKLDRDVLVRDTRVYLLATLRGANEKVVPYRLAPAARDIRETLERYQRDAGECFDLEPALHRAKQVEAAARELDNLLDHIRAGVYRERVISLANRAAINLDRTLVRLSFTANGPFDQDLAIPIPAVPLLEPVRQLARLDRESDQARFLETELVRNRNRVAFELREAHSAVTIAIGELRTLI